MWRLKTPLFPYKPLQEIADAAEEREIKTWLSERERARRYAELEHRLAAKLAHAERPRLQRH